MSRTIRVVAPHFEGDVRLRDGRCVEACATCRHLVNKLEAYVLGYFHSRGWRVFDPNDEKPLAPLSPAEE